MPAAQPLAADSAEGPVPCTPDEYLARERSAETKSEYFKGEAWPMVGASLKHVRIVENIARLLGNQCVGKSTEVFSRDLRVRAGQSYFYPDVVVIEGEPQLEDVHQDTLRNPALVIEVLSPSTEAFDRGRKFMAYRAVESLREYVLVSQDTPRLEHYQRLNGGNDQWVLTVTEGLDGTVRVLQKSPQSEGLTLTLLEVFARIGFQADEQGTENRQ